MVLAELFSLALYLISLLFFRQYFGECIFRHFRTLLIEIFCRLGVHLDD